MCLAVIALSQKGPPDVPKKGLRGGAVAQAHGEGAFFYLLTEVIVCKGGCGLLVEE